VVKPGGSASCARDTWALLRTVAGAVQLGVEAVEVKPGGSVTVAAEGKGKKPSRRGRGVKDCEGGKG
jgi:hypothetical protein